MNKQISDFLSFLDEANSRFTASFAICQRLKKAGFTELKETEKLKLKKGGKYYIRRMDTAVIAFVVGSNDPAESGFSFAASHLDSPALKIKHQSYKCSGGVCRIGIEVYGGPILHTWLDRELGVSGRVVIRKEGEIQSHTVDLARPIAIIPNAAIHINRSVNKDFEYNAQKHLQAFLGLHDSGINPIYELISKELNIKLDDILADDLYFYDLQKAALAGAGQELLISGRLDNLAMTHAILMGILSAKKPDKTAMALFFDHEEIGSRTPQGADSTLLAELTERICLALGHSRDEYYRALRHSFLISADMAHAFHPAYAEKYEADYSTQLNKGPVIKLNANHRYASTADSSAFFIDLCEKAQVPYQRFLVPSDMPCGSTVGPMLSAQPGLCAIDIGNPMWAMHSVRETCGVEDHISLIKVLKHYYQ